MLSSSPYGGACLKISFWKDKWIGKGALEELFPSIHTLCLQQEAIVGKYGQTMAGISFKFYLYEKKKPMAGISVSEGNSMIGRL